EEIVNNMRLERRKQQEMANRIVVSLKRCFAEEQLTTVELDMKYTMYLTEPSNESGHHYRGQQRNALLNCCTHSSSELKGKCGQLGQSATLLKYTMYLMEPSNESGHRYRGQQ
ncbi:hypothetical protein KI387_021428, partial [Taxus chinensis]